jgi:hypothetical protein
MIVSYVICTPPQTQQNQQNQQNQQPRPIYTINSMKRNKSDTDLELINRQTAAYDESAPV